MLYLRNSIETNADGFYGIFMLYNNIFDRLDITNI